ncbi:FAD dependent oxidoreductase-like protein [Lasiosphaeris hirsuta]|uniref:FAD dependent oxidoreductase-like protein n=1 Tax=Lasiosphaeris hirsuta TaxID=260670 RepID=A0AA40DSE5_9PEZI|nr:FAD dependent oxidoreductase-like protein [Lasiosphaeris hirsuta]
MGNRLSLPDRPKPPPPSSSPSPSPSPQALTKVTIFGAGITGMAIATLLPKTCAITIVARDLPGDAPSQGWASPWACAGWAALGGTPREQAMQLDALAWYRAVAAAHPEAGVRRVGMTDLGVAADAWFHGRVPGLREVDGGVGYESAVLDPGVFLPWLRRVLEEQGVKFVRVGTVRSLGELAYLGGHVLVNASGLASLTLKDVRDDAVVMDRTYTALVKSDYRDAFVRRGKTEYSYYFGRGDGTAVLGGISEPVDSVVRTVAEVRADLIRRAHENLPDFFPSTRPEDYTFVRDHVGIRPLRPESVRVEREVVDGQRVIHAYGTTIGGYMLSFGLAREVARLLDEYLFEM